MNFTYRKAKIDDLTVIVELLADDKLGQTREHSSNDIDKAYMIRIYGELDGFSLVNYKAFDQTPDQLCILGKLERCCVISKVADQIY